MDRPTCGVLIALPAVLALCCCGAGVARAAEPKNLVANGGFEKDGDGNGIADGWSFSGDPKGLTAAFSLDAGRDGGKSQKIACTRFVPGTSGWTHVMLCQLDHVKIKQGHRYTLSFWAKGKDVKVPTVGVGLQDTAKWKGLGLYSHFTPTAKWERYEFNFTGERDCREKSRLQIWYNSTGTLWLDDAELIEKAPRWPRGPRRPARLIKPVKGRRNLIPNASFECGPSGWGSRSFRHLSGWTPMNRLFGEVVEDETAPHGSQCLKIDLNAKTMPVVQFDYFDLLRRPIKAPLAGNIGFIELERGKQYVVSAYLRADKAGTPARLGVQFFEEWVHTRTVTVGTKWQRFTFRFNARKNAGYVVVGPDLGESERKECVLLVDAVQLEPGAKSTEFATRNLVEVGWASDQPGNIWFEGERPRIRLFFYNGTGKLQDPVLKATFEDFRGPRGGVGSTAQAPVEPGQSRSIVFEPPTRQLGFHRIRFALDRAPLPGSVRIAVVPKRTRKDSLIGVNHARGWPHLLETDTAAGIVWARDWSLQWQHVEPLKGRFDFTLADHIINRPIQHGQRVLGLLPFPSANWSSSAPASVRAGKRYPANRQRTWYAPRDVNEFKTYVRTTVAHYKGRIKWWQVFNEPLYTNYSLPRKQGYTPADYVRLVKAFHEAARAADPKCKILAGPGGWLSGSGNDLQGMLDAGMLKWCDAVDLHTYPGLRAPETYERDLVAVNRMLERAGGRGTPIWLTEHAYYADDDLIVVPPRPGFPHLLDSERLQAEYSIRFNLILLAHGVRKIFYHSGSCPGLNRDKTESVFYRYNGEPRKIYAAVAAFNALFPPDVEFVRAWPKRDGCWAYLYRAGTKWILAAWQPREGPPAWLVSSRNDIAFLDMMGNRFAAPAAGGPRLSSSPVFAVADGLEQQEFERALSIRARRRKNR